MMEERGYCMQGRVRYSEADTVGRLSVDGVMNYLQDCCTMQAEDLHIGLSYLAAHHLGWFVTSYEIKILEELPPVGQKILVRTWPYKFMGMLGYRNFTIEDEEGRLLVTADSLWVLMNLEEQKPVRRMPEEMQQAYQCFSRLEGDWHLRKKYGPSKGSYCYSFSVSPMWLDTNHHMNNAYYVRAARECLSREEQVSEISVEYKKPALPEDAVNCFVTAEEDRRIVFLENEEREPYAVVEFKTNH